MIGQIISSHRIIEKLAAAEWAFATSYDTNLGRSVALKFLPTISPKTSRLWSGFPVKLALRSALTSQISALFMTSANHDGGLLSQWKYLDGMTLSTQSTAGHWRMSCFFPCDRDCPTLLMQPR